MSVQPLEIRMAHLEGAYEQISERLNGIDNRLTGLDHKIDTRFDAFERKMDARFEVVERRFEASDRRFESLDKKITNAFVAGLTVNAATLAAVIGAIVAAHH
jgi:predicted nuclease with TOPRIM domain